MTSISKFVSDHKALCILTGGTAVIGYMGYKCLKWLLEKVGIIAKVDEVGRANIQTPQSSTISDRAEDQVASSFGPPIVERGLSVREYNQNEYGGGTENAQKYSNRLQLISSFFNKEVVYPVRGDGNCFCNAAIVGLIHLIQADPRNRAKFINILQEYAAREDLYVTPDTNDNVPAYSRTFSKQKDFDLTIRYLQREHIGVEDLTTKFDVAASFSRIIRYMIYCNQEDAGFPANEISLESGQAIDMNAVVIFNGIFDLNSKMAVLKADSNEANPQQAKDVYVVKGKDLYANSTAVLDMTQQNARPDKECDFLFVRKEGHYIALVNNLR